MTKNDLNMDIAFEQMMKENSPNYKKYDSGADGILEECRSCHFHRPDWEYRSCVFKFCPYSEEPVCTKK